MAASAEEADRIVRASLTPGEDALREVAEAWTRSPTSEALGEDADNDGLLFSGDLHPVTLHRMLDELVPMLRGRGILRSSRLRRPAGQPVVVLTGAGRAAGRTGRR